MSKAYFLSDHLNGKAFVMNGPKGTVATFYYGNGITKKQVKKGANTYCRQLNELSK